MQEVSERLSRRSARLLVLGILSKLVAGRSGRARARYSEAVIAMKSIHRLREPRDAFQTHQNGMVASARIAVFVLHTCGLRREMVACQSSRGGLFEAGEVGWG